MHQDAQPVAREQHGRAGAAAGRQRLRMLQVGRREQVGAQAAGDRVREQPRSAELALHAAAERRDDVGQGSAQTAGGIELHGIGRAGGRRGHQDERERAATGIHHAVGSLALG